MKKKVDFDYELNFKLHEADIPALEMLRGIFNALNETEDAWCYCEKQLDDDDKYDVYRFKYIFTFSYRSYFFKVFADLSKKNMYFVDKLNFLHEDEDLLTESEIFEINEETFFRTLKKFMDDNKLKHIIERGSGNLKLRMFLEAIFKNIEELADDIVYFDDGEDVREIFDFLQDGNDKHIFEIHNELILKMVTGNYKCEVNNGESFKYMRIYFDDNMIEMEFDLCGSKWELLTTSIEKVQLPIES